MTWSLKIIEAKLLFTGNGYAGIGSTAMGIGDEVWVIQGALLVFILHPNSEFHMHFIGDAYVHSIMKGELVHPSAMFGAQKIYIL